MSQPCPFVLEDVHHLLECNFCFCFTMGGVERPEFIQCGPFHKEKEEFCCFQEITPSVDFAFADQDAATTSGDQHHQEGFQHVAFVFSCHVGDVGDAIWEPDTAKCTFAAMSWCCCQPCCNVVCVAAGWCLELLFECVFHEVFDGSVLGGMKRLGADGTADTIGIVPKVDVKKCIVTVTQMQSLQGVLVCGTHSQLTVDHADALAINVRIAAFFCLCITRAADPGGGLAIKQPAAAHFVATLCIGKNRSHWNQQFDVLLFVSKDEVEIGKCSRLLCLPERGQNDVKLSVRVSALSSWWPSTTVRLHMRVCHVAEGAPCPGRVSSLL